ncbi:MAG: hypothetical protein IPG63_05990 [Xanthomonadales bacterium]|nr:hypothetical protein [Xanthomonadales bacterium]
MMRDPLSRLSLRPSWAWRLRAAWFGALVAGTLDLGYAIYGTVSAGRAPLRMLQSIASGWQGRAAYDGGLVSAALGVVSHYGILFVFAAAFVDACMRRPALVQQPLRHGVLLGIAVYVLMQAVIVPLSAAPFSLPHGLGDVVEGLLVHLCLVGLPIVYVARYILGRVGWPPGFRR